MAFSPVVLRYINVLAVVAGFSLPSWICQPDCAANWERVVELYENVFSAVRSWLSFSCMYQIFIFQPSTATATSVQVFDQVCDLHLESELL